MKHSSTGLAQLLFHRVNAAERPRKRGVTGRSALYGKAGYAVSLGAGAYLILVLLFSILGGGLAPLAAQSAYNAPGDTLTVVMAPLPNIPAIHIPGEPLAITCFAPPSTTGWQAQLKHGSRTVGLSISSSQYLNSPDRWELQAAIPQLPVWELYDLRVTASGGIDDTVRNAVQVVPSRRSSYYFIHITDPHLPTRIYYPDAGFDSDSTSVNDFRSVIEDINILRPEFVLLTGDLLNEGELEGFAGQYWYGWTQRLLEELEVPCFVTAGNHDLGGWNSTPPPAGSARRNWWRYFGWPWLDNASTTWPLHTQDYDFSYGPLHFIGLEAYDNYDNWRANIYGGQSFTWNQIQWLNARLTLHPDKTRVLFHHYDYSDQLNLAALGADMALWGHIHYNEGSVSTFPYNLATRSVCNGNRAYRPVRVNGSTLQPLNTLYAGSTGTNLTVAYYPSNAAIADSVRATVQNNQAAGFEHSLLKFRMPPGNWAYHAYNGTLEQVDRGATENVCYVRFNLAANSVQQVSVAVAGVASEDPLLEPGPLIAATWPNPFREGLSVELAPRSGEARVRVYNLRGEFIRALESGPEGACFTWDGRLGDGSAAPAGVYFLRVTCGRRSEAKRVLKLR